MLSAFGRLSSRDGKASAFFGMRAARRQSRRGFDCTHAVTAGGSGDSTVTTKSFFVVESLRGIVTRRPRPLGSVTPAKAGGIKPDPHCGRALMPITHLSSSHPRHASFFGQIAPSSALGASASAFARRRRKGRARPLRFRQRCARLFRHWGLHPGRDWRGQAMEETMTLWTISECCT